MSAGHFYGAVYGIDNLAYQSQADACAGCGVVAVERFENVWKFVFGYSASGVGESYVKHCVSFLHADCYSTTIGGEFQRVGHQVGE